MSAVRFRFVGEGIDVVGPVQGNGGLVPSLARLEQQQRWACEGKPLGIYEPKPGCVCVFPDYSAESNGRRVHVLLTTVEISVFP